MTATMTDGARTTPATHATTQAGTHASAFVGESAPPRSIETATPVHERVHEVVREIASPARLLPEPPLPAAESLPMDAISMIERATSARTGGPGNEATEVHVHIGRIEVIGNAAPAASRKREASARRQTRPLADYLAGSKRE
jgi:hypothetical protein